MTGARRGNAIRLRTLAWGLAVWPVFARSEPPLDADAAFFAPIEPVVEQRWWSSAELPEQLIRLLPGEALEGAARTLLEKKVQVRLDRDRAFLQVRIPLG